ncbi:MAG TPA: hypothetical protein V6D18_05575 [Thermosynechococcaceae cyanobacterium]
MKWLLLASVSCLLGLFIHLGWTKLSAANIDIPKESVACLPQRRPMVTPLPPYTYKRIASETVNDQTYHLIEVGQPEDPKYPWESLILTNSSGQCVNLIPERQRVRSLTKFMSYDTAKQLALARYRKWLEQPDGKQRIERLVRLPQPRPGAPADLDLDQPLLAPEDNWALRQLGIAIPPQYKTEPIQPPPLPLLK